MHPTADRSFFEKMIAAHIRHYGTPTSTQRDYLQHVAEDLVADLGVGVQFAASAGRGATSEWSRSRFQAQGRAVSSKHRVIRRFDTRSEDDD